ncbi:MULTISPECIES: VOC family protein [unclassified Mycolicibacterium]|uniref:VOC family protein n=1 Tax=unclassified Mycolicibacterium TaxID=2636767 RepID=UPI002EDB81C4
MDKPQRVVLQEGGAAGALCRTAVSHIGLSVPDVGAAANFYQRVLGLTVHDQPAPDRVRLGWGVGHHVIELVQGDKGLRHYGFEVRDSNGVEAISKRLADAGYSTAELGQDYLDGAVEGAPAHGVVVADPHGIPVHFHTAVQRRGECTADTGRRPIKYQHITLGTDDVAAMAAFFVDVVGFRISDQLEDGRFAWLRSDRDHHTLAVVNVGRGGDIDHFSFDLAKWADFKEWCDRLTDEDVDVTWGPGRHGPGNNLFVFFDDPVGNHIELSAEMEKFHDDRVTYVPRRWKPIPNTVNLWGGQLASWRKTSEGK